jgi:(5-formylfuran-3-yl)methyl phosphate synthase
MQLLVSVSDVDEAQAALLGGAIVIDAKDPILGALGAVSLDVFRGIHTLVGGIRPVSAALGDAVDEEAMEHTARAYAGAGAGFVKIGFAQPDDTRRAGSLIAAAVRGASPAGCAVIAATYADHAGAVASRDELVTVAANAGATGVLIDTTDKGGPGLRSLVATDVLTAWIAAAHDAGLIVSVAGKLTSDDLAWARDCGADIAGVRGAACIDGRTSRISAENVRLLRALTSPST